MPLRPLRKKSTNSSRWEVDEYETMPMFRADPEDDTEEAAMQNVMAIIFESDREAFAKIAIDALMANPQTRDMFRTKAREYMRQQIAEQLAQSDELMSLPDDRLLPILNMGSEDARIAFQITKLLERLSLSIEPEELKPIRDAAIVSAVMEASEVDKKETSQTFLASTLPMGTTAVYPEAAYTKMKA